MIKQYNKSVNLLKRAKIIIPSASQTYSKSYKYYVEGVAPAFIERGHAAYVWDIDNNKYLDFVLGLGAVTIGYGNEYINQAVVKQIKKGVSFSQPSPLEVELAEILIDLIPCAEMVRFLKNGSDATAAAVRLARAYTNREMIVCCGYHGWQDWYIGCTENDKGVPKSVKKLIKKFTYNDISSLENCFNSYKGKIAAVILEPVQSDYPQDNFLQKVKEITHKNKAILIFDEVVTGFRLATAGAQEYFEVIPDLAAFGKGMANGFSLSVLVGKKELLQLIDRGVFISTTFGGDALSIIAAIKTIELFKKYNVTDHFWEMGNYFIKSAKNLIKKEKMDKIASVKGLAPHCGILFNDYQQLSGLEFLSVFQQRLIQQGILSVGINNFCFSHTKKDIDVFMEAAHLGFKDVKKALDKNTTKDILLGKPIRPIFRRG